MFSCDDEKPFLSAKEVGDLLGISRSRVYQLITAKQIPATRFSGCTRIPRKAWNEWLERKNEDALSGLSTGDTFTENASPIAI
jgi:excisionase family DNA binding protein